MRNSHLLSTNPFKADAKMSGFYKNYTGSTAVICILLVISIKGCRAATDTYYRGAVLQHVPFGVGEYTHSHTEIIENNFITYELAARTAAGNGADILVYPEWGLYPNGNESRESVMNYVEDIPDPKYEVSNPCDEEDRFRERQVLRRLSCMAKENGLFVVVNLFDRKECVFREKCEDREVDFCFAPDDKRCPDDGRLFFNTNVVFDRQGNLVARYYKTHLYFEVGVDMKKRRDATYFDTDFGRFTTLICFDLMFEEAMKAVEDVVNVAYPTYWYDHSPLIFFASLYQQSWAMFNQVNLLASNVQFPNTGTLGSGIYSGERGALVTTHNPHGKIKLLVSNVPKNPRGDTSDIPIDPKRFILENGVATESPDRIESKFLDDHCGNDTSATSTFTDYRCGATHLGHYIFRKLEGREGHVELCSAHFCCSLNYQADSMDEDYYFGVTSEPLNFYDAFQFGTEVCLLSRCEEQDGRPCARQVLKSKTLFRMAKIEGNFSTPYIFPYAVDSDVVVTDRGSWSFDRKSKIEYENAADSSLLFFGLYGRLFEQDKELVE